MQDDGPASTYCTLVGPIDNKVESLPRRARLVPPYLAVNSDPPTHYLKLLKTKSGDRGEGVPTPSRATGSMSVRCSFRPSRNCRQAFGTDARHVWNKGKIAVSPLARGGIRPDRCI